MLQKHKGYFNNSEIFVFITFTQKICYISLLNIKGTNEQSKEIPINIKQWY